MCNFLNFLTGNVLSSIENIDVVEAWRERDVLHTAAAIFVVFARHLGLGRTLDGYAQTTGACPPIVDALLKEDERCAHTQAHRRRVRSSTS